jgi:hypothetical protein
MGTRPQVVAAVATLLLVLPPSVSAQSRPTELGIDAGALIDLSDDTNVILGLPVQNLRVGFFISDAISIEPQISFTYFNLTGDSGVAVDGEIGPVFHLSPNRSRSQAYLRPFGGISYVSDDDAVFLLGGGVGIKLPVAERLAVRLEASYAHGFVDFGGGDLLTIGTGISFFTR